MTSADVVAADDRVAAATDDTGGAAGGDGGSAGASTATSGSDGARPPAPASRLWLKALIGAAITAGLFYFLLSLVDWKQVESLQHGINWWLQAATLPLYLLLYALRTRRFVLLAPKTPFSVMYCITAVHNFMLRVLPMRTGELAYAFLVRRAGTSGIGESLLGLFLLRVLDATAVVLIFTATLALDRSTYQGNVGEGLLIAGGFAAAGVLCAVYFRQLLLLGFWLFEGTLELVGLTRYARIERLTARLGALIRGYSKLTLGTILQQSGLTLLMWMIGFSMVHVVMRGFSIDVTFAQSVLGGTGATVVGFLPVSGIGTFGALEAGWALGFRLVGLSQSLAIASGFGYSLVSFAGAALIALVAWIGFNRLVASTGSADER